MNLAACLGPSANVSPSPIAAAAIRKAVLRPRDQYPKTSMQSAPRCLDGPDPYAYALHHGIVTLQEVGTFLAQWRDDEAANRGLGTGRPKAAPVWINQASLTAWPKNVNGKDVDVTIHDCQHETMQQYLTGAEALGDTVSARAPVDLLDVIVADPIVADPKAVITNPRQHGRPARALMQQGSGQAHLAAGVIFGKVFAQMGKKNGLAYYMLAPLKADHANLPINPQQQSTILGALALGYAQWPVPLFRDAIYHGLDMLAAVQMPDGSFANDAGWDAGGRVVLSNPGQVMDGWILPNVIAAKHALGPLWPAKAQTILDRARALWLATGYMKPSAFKAHNVLSVAIGCAPEYGWRS